MGSLWRYKNSHGSEVNIIDTSDGGLVFEVNDHTGRNAIAHIDSGLAKELAVVLARRFAVTLAEIQGITESPGDDEPCHHDLVKIPLAFVEMWALVARDETFTPRRRTATVNAFTALLDLMYHEAEGPSPAPTRPNPFGVGGGGVSVNTGEYRPKDVGF